MAVDRNAEDAILEEMKKKLLEQFRSCSRHDCGESEEVAANTAAAYATVVQAQLALERIEIPASMNP